MKPQNYFRANTNVKKRPDKHHNKLATTSLKNNKHKNYNIK